MIEKPGNDCENGAEQGSNILKSGVNSGENSNGKEETPIQTPKMETLGSFQNMLLKE